MGYQGSVNNTSIRNATKELKKGHWMDHPCGWLLLVCMCACWVASVMSNCVTSWTVVHQILWSWDSPGKNTRVGCNSLLQGIFLTWVSNSHLPLSSALEADSLPTEIPGNVGSPSNSYGETLIPVWWYLNMVSLLLLLLLLSHFSRVRPCATPWTAAHQAPLSLGFSRQEHWSGLPFPSPMHESEKWKWSRSVMSDL